MKKLIIIILLSTFLIGCSLEKRADLFMKKATKLEIAAKVYYFDSDTSYIIKSNSNNNLDIYID